jgi:hypothetical protein
MGYWPIRLICYLPHPDTWFRLLAVTRRASMCNRVPVYISPYPYPHRTLTLIMTARGGESNGGCGRF